LPIATKCPASNLASNGRARPSAFNSAAGSRAATVPAAVRQAAASSDRVAVDLKSGNGRPEGPESGKGSGPAAQAARSGQELAVVACSVRELVLAINDRAR